MIKSSRNGHIQDAKKIQTPTVIMLDEHTQPLTQLHTCARKPSDAHMRTGDVKILKKGTRQT